MYQSPLERSRLRKESVDSNLSSKAATPIKSSKEITSMMESTSQENQPLSSSNSQKTNNDKRKEPMKRGRKRKVTNSPAKIVLTDQVCNVAETKPKKLKF